MASLERTGLDKAFKLRSSLSTSNMVFFDKEGKIRKYASEREILEDFADTRLEYYHKRKAHLLKVLRQQLEILAAKARFIQLVAREEVKVKNRKKEAIIQDLVKHKFRTLHEITEGSDIDVPGGHDGDGAGEEDASKKDKKKGGGWEYLLGMALWSLTHEKVLELEAQVRTKEAEVEELELTAPEEIWERDLDAVLAALDEADEHARRALNEERRMRDRAAKRAASAAAGGGK